MITPTLGSSAQTNLIGLGIYSIPEAARLSGVTSSRIRRWVRGYTYRTSGSLKKSPPVWQSQIPANADGTLAISFLDLIEIRFVNAFLAHGVSWPVIRRAESHASQRYDTRHPFAAKKFKTDGRRIFASLREHDPEPALLDLADNQLAFEKVISPYLLGLEFEGNAVTRWRPLGPRTAIVIDPQRSFGQPIVDKEGVPTAVLASAFKAEGSEEAVARWYQVSPRSVRQAVNFESNLAA